MTRILTTGRVAVLAAALLSMAGSGALAATVYVNDELEITLRSGQSTGHSIVRMLSSGTALEVLGESGDNGYTHVRTPQGTEGYVLSRFLTAEPIARDRLAQANRRLAFLNEEKARLDTEIADLKSRLGNVQGERGQFEAQGRELARELEDIRRTAASTLAIAAENDTLKERLNTASGTIASLEEENELLRDERARNWFIIGSAVTVAGVLIGLILPRIRWRRRSRWSSL
ncbi:MAG: TIGR04211 family SH3 domain-containing protein [Pseudomonadota bacterium]